MQISQTNKNLANDFLQNKVPQVTVAFWTIKVCATTVGKTGGDALSMTMQLGYAVSSLIFLVLFSITLTVQVTSKRYHPFAYGLLLWQQRLWGRRCRIIWIGPWAWDISNRLFSTLRGAGHSVRLASSYRGN